MISGVVLAAGTSARLGRPKQLLELGGRPLLQHAVDAVAGADLDEVIVVLGHEARRVAAAITLPGNGRAVVNPAYLEGQWTSLECGLEACDPTAEAAVIVVGDQPGLGSAAIVTAVAAYRQASATIVRTTWEGRPGHPVVLGRPTWEEWLRSKDEGGDMGARNLIASAPHKLDVEMGRPAPADVDAWEDYEGLLGRSHRH